jgi:Protein of unknown function (DUF1566)
MTANRPMLATVVIATVLLTWTLVLVTPALAGPLSATGQTTPTQADKNDGISGPVAVPDDGTLQRGADLRYQTRLDGTIRDVATGLIWEVKCSGCGGLHEVNNTYVWSGNGMQETIWDWLDDINAEGGTGYTGHDNWRIPNLREMQSIADYGRFNPSIDPIFTPTAASIYWSSTSIATFPSGVAWGVDFVVGDIDAFSKVDGFHVRAVRGGRR